MAYNIGGLTRKRLRNKIMESNTLNLFENIEQHGKQSLSAVEAQVIIALRIPVIQLWQPWASWVMEGWKLIETRTHNKFYWMLNKIVAIHACKKWDEDAVRLARPYLVDWQIRETEKFRGIRGMIIGKAKVIEYRELDKSDSVLALIDCEHTQRFGLILRQITKIKPIKFIGAQRQLYIDEAQL